MSWRPDTLKEAVRRYVDGEEPGGFFFPLRDLYNHVYCLPLDARESAFVDEPAMTENPQYDAYAAAVAEHFALRYKFRTPRWTINPERFLDKPWFPCGSEYLKAILFAESPIAFRRRFIYVDRDPCYRPSRDRLEPECSPAFNKIGRDENGAEQRKNYCRTAQTR